MGLFDLFKRLVNKEELGNNDENITPEYNASLPIDEEERVVVALAASIMAGKDKPDSHFHISKITRIK
ncbi:hypothetical protein [Clostridium peptidivorans]|uniref:hypothetical protein n=1 Tax=Clostridium peptidivorans TaxID=100174 RepID=UPI000BE39515|nr:hypothetical protein [Clostridium peptidivorans]